MNLFDLADKTAIITGGGGVLGGTMALSLANAGVKVALVNRTLEKAQRIVASSKNGLISAHRGDVTNLADMEKINELLLNDWGKIDILINAAGGNFAGATIGPDQTFFDLSLTCAAFVSASFPSFPPTTWVSFCASRSLSPFSDWFRSPSFSDLTCSVLHPCPLLTSAHPRLHSAWPLLRSAGPLLHPARGLLHFPRRTCCHCLPSPFRSCCFLLPHHRARFVLPFRLY